MVRAVVRRQDHELPPAIETVQAEITDGANLAKAMRGARYVYHLAAKLHINHPTPDLYREYQRVNIEGTRAVARAARECKVERLVFFSTINVYGSSLPTQVSDETSPARPDSWYAETKLEAERIITEELGERATVLRLATIYGRTMKGNYLRLLQALHRKRFVMVGEGSNRRTLIHVDDVCRAALLAAQHPRACGRTFNVTDGNIHTVAEVIVAMSDALRRKRVRLHLPVTPVRVAASLGDSTAHLLGKRSVQLRFAVEKFLEDIAASGELMRRELGFEAQYDLKTGWREVVSHGVD